MIRCASSMAIRTGSGGRDIAASNRPTTARFDTAADAIAPKTSVPSGSRRSIAAARSVRSTTGSLSLSSAVSQATGAELFRRPLDEEARLAVAGRRDDRHDGSRVDRSWRNSLVRRNVPTCRRGMTNLASRRGSRRLLSLSPLERLPRSIASIGTGEGEGGNASTGWRRGPATEPVGQGGIVAEAPHGGLSAPRR